MGPVTFIALAKIRAKGVDQFLFSNVELHRREYIGSAALRDLRRACDAMRLAAGFIFTQGRAVVGEVIKQGRYWCIRIQFLVIDE